MPTRDRSGPSRPPRPLTRWQLAQWARNSRSPFSALPLGGSVGSRRGERPQIGQDLPDLVIGGARRRPAASRCPGTPLRSVCEQPAVGAARCPDLRDVGAADPACIHAVAVGAADAEDAHARLDRVLDRLRAGSCQPELLARRRARRRSCARAAAASNSVAAVDSSSQRFLFIRASLVGRNYTVRGQVCGPQRTTIARLLRPDGPRRPEASIGAGVLARRTPRAASRCS